MPSVGPAEILVILVVALLVFGPNRLPEIGRQVGKAMRELRRMQTSLRDEVREVLEPVTTEPAHTPQLPPEPDAEVRAREVDADDSPDEHPEAGYDHMSGADPGPAGEAGGRDLEPDAGGTAPTGSGDAGAADHTEGTVEGDPASRDAG